MIEVKILLDQEMYPDATEGILRAIINDALGRYRSYDPQRVTIKEVPERTVFDTPKVDEHTNHQINYASNRLKDAQESGLIAEVMVYALKEMQESKGELTICSVIHAGCKEWDV